jgi:hypothetical protein
MFYVTGWGNGQTIAIEASRQELTQDRITATLKSISVQGPEKKAEARLSTRTIDYALVTDASWKCTGKEYLNRLQLSNKTSQLHWWRNEYNDFFWNNAQIYDAPTPTIEPKETNCEKYGINCGYVDAIWPYIPKTQETEIGKQKFTNCARTNECPGIRAFCRGTMGLAIAETMDEQRSQRNSDHTAEKAQQKVIGRCVGPDVPIAKEYLSAKTDPLKKPALLEQLVSGPSGNCGRCITKVGPNSKVEKTWRADQQETYTEDYCLGVYHIYIRGHGFGVDPEELPTVIFKNLDTKAMPSGLELVANEMVSETETKHVTRLSSRLLKVKVPQAAGTTYNVRFDIIIQRGETTPRRSRRRGQMTPMDTLEAKPESCIFKYGFTYLCECDALNDVLEI